MEVQDYSDYLVLFDIPPAATICEVLSIFERYGEISHFCFVGKDFHIGRGFLKYKSQDSKDECLQMAGYNDFTKPEYEKQQSLIFILQKPIIVTPIQEKEAVLMRRKQKKQRNMSLLNIGNDITDSIYKGEMSLRQKIIDQRQHLFFSNAEYSVSKRTLRFYNCPRNMNKGMLREIFRGSVENFVNIYISSFDPEKSALAKQIDKNRIRITNVELHDEDGSASITFSNHYQALASLLQLNGDLHEFTSISPIIHFDLRKKIIPFPGAKIIPEYPSYMQRHPLPPQ